MMGKKGDKLTQESIKATEELVSRLNTIDGVTTKKMFGGHGVFHDSKMFGIIDSKGQAFLKADDSTLPDFQAADSSKHSRMPYYSIPEDVLEDDKSLLKWVNKSITISKS